MRCRVCTLERCRCLLTFASLKIATGVVCQLAMRKSTNTRTVFLHGACEVSAVLRVRVRLSVVPSVPWVLPQGARLEFHDVAVSVAVSFASPKY